MRRHRLDRLASLTKGAVLVGFGLQGAACAKGDSPPEPIHINAPMPEQPSATPEASAAPLASATAGATPSATSGGSASAVPTAALPGPPRRVNAVPRPPPASSQKP